jgi:excisionase family DNA binding protein
VTESEIRNIVELAVGETLRAKYSSPLEDFALTVADAASLMGLSTDSVLNLIHSNRLGHVGKGKLLRVKQSHIAKYERAESDLKGGAL